MFVNTIYAKKLFESQIPKIIKELGRIADALEEANKQKAKENTK